MSLFKKSFPPKEAAFYITCKNAEQRNEMIKLLEAKGFKMETSLKLSWETHPNIQVHQSDIFAKDKGHPYFNVWSLKPNGINTGAILKVYSAKKFL